MDRNSEGFFCLKEEWMYFIRFSPVKIEYEYLKMHMLERTFSKVYSEARLRL